MVNCIDFAQLYIYMAQVEMKRLEPQDKVATQFNLVVFEGDRNEALSFGKHLEREKETFGSSSKAYQNNKAIF